MSVLPIVARCPICKRDYVSVPSNGGTCLWCKVKLHPVSHKRTNRARVACHAAINAARRKG